MIRIVFLVSLLFSFFYGEDYFDTVIEKIEVSEDFVNYKEFTSTNEYLNKKIKKASIRITINKDEIKRKNYYLSVVSDMDSLVYTNTKYTQNKNIIHIKLDEIQKNILYFNYIYSEPKVGQFRCDVIDEFEFRYLLPYEGILYGVAYGIIFCAFLYYLVIFISTRILAFFHYSIMQLFVLLSLIGFVYVSFLSFPNQEFSYTQAMIDIFETAAFLFTLLFAKEILHTKKQMPKMDMFLNLFVVLNILDIGAIFFYKYSILYEYMRFDVGFLVPALAGLVAIYKGNRFAWVYTFGWFTMFVLVYIAEKQILPISGIYTIHIAAPLESLIFSFALGLMLRRVIDEQNEKEKLLIHKNKLASMGEMINNIAHQWRQPLTHISYVNMNLQFAVEDEKIDRKYLKEKIEESNNQIDFMSNTIDNFKDFYKPSKEKQKFLVSHGVEKSIGIMKPLVENNGIKLIYKIDKDKELFSYENEYSQVVLNLITNAKDQLIKKEIENPKIFIKVENIDNRSITTVCDNGGGIEEEYLDKVFEPYFTTKQKGSGIGLYMSRTIINSHFDGELNVENKDGGACFKIIV